MGNWQEGNYAELNCTKIKRALIFRKKGDMRVLKLQLALTSCGFKVHLIDIHQLLPTLKRSIISNFVCSDISQGQFLIVSVCGLTSDEGWLMVFVIAPIENTPGEENAELAIKIKNELIPIQQITGLFVGLKCASYAEKPKVFFFLDLDSEQKVDGRPSVCH
jgi:hypothetical protein